MSDKDYLIKGEMYQYNLGWLINELMSFKQDLATAIDLKTIKYADPIQWDITMQYPANTVVVDPKSGTAYMSKVPVPAGVELTNTNYWVIVFNYQDIYNKIMDGVAFNDRDQDYATKDLLVNDLVWYAGDLYRVTRAIPTGSKYIPGTNLVKTTIESLLARYYGRDRTAQISNDTVNVSGDYTLVAGDIAETSTNRTIKVTKDREIDVDGSDSVHVDGASTLNVGGLRTEAYAGDKTVGVTGAYTGKFGSASFETGAPSWLVKFPDKTVDLADISKLISLAGSNVITATAAGCKGDGITDDTASMQAAINTYSVVYIPKGTYIINGVDVPSNKIIIGESETETILKPSSITTHVLQSLYYDAQAGKGYNSGSHNCKILNLTVNGDNKAVYGIRIVGYRYEIGHCYIKNCETGIASQWSNSLGEGDDGQAFESFLHHLFIDRCTGTGLVFNGPHDSIISDSFIRLCENGVSVINTDYSTANGTLFNLVHVYASKKTGFYSNAEIFADILISESNGYNTMTPSAAYGFALDARSIINNLLAFNNKSGGLLVQADQCNIRGDIRNNATFDVSVTKDNNVINVSGVTPIVTDTGMGNEIVINGAAYHNSRKEASVRYDIAVPSAGKNNAYKNTTGTRMIVYMANTVTSVTIIRKDNTEIFIPDTNVFIVENGDSVYFVDGTTPPATWTWVPML